MMFGRRKKFERVQALFVDISGDFAGRVVRSGVNPASRIAFLSFHVGSLYLSMELLQYAPLVKRLWGDGTKEKANALVGICSIPMVSIWFEHSGQAERMEPHELAESRQNAVEAMLLFCECDSRDLLTKANIMLGQYDHERFRENGGEHGDSKSLFLNYGTMFLAIIQETWMRSHLLDWANMEYPIDSGQQLKFLPPATFDVVTGMSQDGLSNLFQTTTRMLTSGAQMLDYYRQKMKKMSGEQG